MSKKAAVKEEVGPEDVNPALLPLLVPIGKLVEDDKNAWGHPEESFEAAKISLQTYGQQYPLSAFPDGRMIGGNNRLRAARALGWKRVAIIWWDRDENKGNEFKLVDNRIPQLGRWKTEILDDALRALRGSNFDFAGLLNFKVPEIKAMGLTSMMPPDVHQDEVPEIPKTAITKKGDLWILGDHRLLCGDSTDPKDVARVMNKKTAQLFSTDPPYLVDYTGDDRPNDSGKDWSAVYHEIEIEDAEAFFRSMFTNALPHLDKNAAWYCWHASKRSSTIERIWGELGILNHQTIVWVKSKLMHGHSFWPWQHEPCLFGWQTGHKPNHDGDATISTVWQIPHDVHHGDHPTIKPVELFARPMRKHTKEGDLCFEPFSGSGTQIIAAEQLHRRTYALEIEPLFVDVAVERWQSLTGKKAKRAKAA